jgi:hypothetical protein
MKPLGVLYKPMGLVGGVLAAKVSRELFRVTWSWIDAEPPPGHRVRSASTRQIVTAAALQAAIDAGTRAAVDQVGARSFHFLVGVWPGPERPEPDKAEKKAIKSREKREKRAAKAAAKTPPE